MCSVASPARSVLVVDDEQAVLMAYRNALRPRAVFTTDSAVEALEIALHEEIDLALVDLRLENQPSASLLGVQGRRGRYPACGVDVVAALRKSSAEMRIVVITGGRSWAYSTEARAAGANGVMSKRHAPEDIISIIESDAIDRYDTPPEDPMTLDRATYEYLTRIFVLEQRNVQRTAEVLGITRNKLKRKLREGPPER